MLDLVKEYFTKELKIFNSEKQRYVWILYWILSIASFSGLSALFFKIVITSYNSVFYLFGGIFFIILFYLAIRIFLENTMKGYILVTLFFSACAFLVEKYLINNEIFSPFTTRTIVILWVSFLTLFLSIFYERISKWILLFFPPILILGALTSFCFVLIMIPFMLIGWIAIVFLGLGILPYTPLMAFLAFLYMSYKVFWELRDNKYYLQYTFSKYLTYLVLILTSVYFIWFQSEWNRGQFIIRNHFLETKMINSKKSLIDDDLPAWASLGMKLPVNHVSELYLQPESNNRQVLFSFFGSDKLFDPFAFVVSNISKKSDLPNEDREHLLKLLFGYTHTSLNRLWNGNSLLTTDVESKLRIYPEARLVYTEIKMSVYNEAGFGDQEAIYTFKIPEGSVCNHLSLWIDGKEEPARLTFLSKAQKAYNTIVGVERRDPSYVMWMEDNLLRVRVFPVPRENYRTFKIGFISPLSVKNQSLEYKGFQIEGPPLDSAKHTIEVNLITQNDISLSADGYNFQKKVNKNSNQSSSNWFAYGKYKENWGITIESLPKISGYFQFADLQLKVTDLQEKEVDFNPAKIYILINSSLSKKEWKRIYSELAALNLDVQIVLVTNEWFYSRSVEENLDFIENQNLPKFNLFPFYKIANETDILVVTNKEDSSIPFEELKGSLFYNNNKDFFGKNKKKLYVFSMNQSFSTFLNSLIEYELIQSIRTSFDSLKEALSQKKIAIPENSDKKYSLPDSKITIEIEKSKEKQEGKGNDLLARMVLYKRILRAFGKRLVNPNRDVEQKDLFEMAELGRIVSPVTSLLVLESERDYKRFGIDKNKEGLPSTSEVTQNASLMKQGNVPEPEEWLIAIICILSLLYLGKYRFKRV